MLKSVRGRVVDNKHPSDSLISQVVVCDMRADGERFNDHPRRASSHLVLLLAAFVCVITHQRPNDISYYRCRHRLN